MNLLIFAITIVSLMSGGRDVPFAVPQALAAAVRQDGAAFDGPKGDERTIATLAAILKFESDFRMDAIGDHGMSVCGAQILLPPGTKTPEGWTRELLLSEPVLCVRRSLAMVKESLAVCHAVPLTERLALYARGDCYSDKGRKLSHARMAYARGWFNEASK